MNIAVDKNGDEDAGQQGWIRRRRRCGIEIDDMWDDGDGELTRQISTGNNYQPEGVSSLQDNGYGR